MMTIFSLYLPILLSLSLSFLLHAFKKHVHSFFLHLATTFKNSINTTSINYHHPVSSSSIVTHANGSPPSHIRFVDEEIGGGVDKMMCCTESLGFESIDEMGFDDQIDKIEDHDDIDKDNNNNMDDVDEDEDEDEEGCCEGRRDWTELNKSFPPPLSSLNQKGQPSFVLVPVRKNGRLKLNKVRIKRPEILYASREDGRLRLYLVPDHCNDVEEEEEYEGEEEQEEELIEEEEEEDDDDDDDDDDETIVESQEDEEIIRYEKEEDRVVGDWKFHNIEGFRRCHQVVNQCHHHNHHHYHYHHHHNLHMYGVSIA